MNPTELALVIPRGLSVPKGISIPRGIKELRRLSNSNAPVLAFSFKRRRAEDWYSSHSHAHGQLLAFTTGLLVMEAGKMRWMFPSPRCVWIPPNFEHSTRSVGVATGLMLALSPQVCRGLARRPCMFSSSQLLFAIIERMLGWDPWQSLNAGQKRLLAVLRDELRRPDQHSLNLPIPREERLAGVARAMLQDLADDRTLEAWAQYAGMARRTFMRAFSADVGLTFGRWRQQARLFAALEMLVQGKSVTETAIGVGYNSVSAFVEMFRTMMGSAPQKYLRSQKATTALPNGPSA